MAMQPTRPPWEDYRVTSSPVDGPWRDFQAPPAQQPSAFQTVDDTVRQVAKGATLGFADELAAGADAAVGGLTGQPGTFSERYDANLAGERARDRAFQERNPIASVALQAAGSMANPITRFSAMGSLPLQMARNAGIGGFLGGVAGFGEGEGGVMNRLLSGTTGAATGAAVGAAIPPIATALAKGARTVGGWMGLNNAQTDAQRQLIRALSADQAAGGDDLAGLAARLHQAAPDQPMILPDVTMPGGQTEGLAQAVSREPGIGRATAAAAVAQRGGLNQSARLSSAVRNAISADDFMAATDDLIRTRAATAGPAYEKALAVDTPVNVQPIVDDITARLGSAKGAIKTALQDALNLFKDGTGKPDVTMAGLHETKLALDAMLERTPGNSVSRVARREIMQIQEKLLRAMDDASGGAYGQARQAFAGPSRAMDAMELGKRILRGDADETAAEIAKLSASERDFLRIGVSRALIDRVKAGGDTDDIRKIKSIWGSDAIRERVAAAFDDPKAFDDFSEYMKREMDMARVNNAINPRANSVTAAINAQRDQPAPTGPMLSALVSALRGDTLGAGTNVLRATSDALSPAVTLRAEQLAPMLFSMRAGDRSRVINELMRRQTTDEARAALARALGAGVTRAGTMTGVQLQD